MNKVSTCLEGVKPRGIEYKEYYKNGRRVKEYVIKVEANITSDNNDPINLNFLLHMLGLVYLPDMGGGADQLGIILCQTTTPPSCPSTVPPNGKLLQPVSAYQGNVTSGSEADNASVTVTAVDSSTDQYSWNNIILKWASPKTFGGTTYSFIAYVSTSGSKGSNDIIRVVFQILLRSTTLFTA